MTANSLLHLRRRAGASQADIARRMGLGLPFVAAIETGQRPLTTTVAGMFAQACAEHIQGMPFEVHTLAGSSEATDGFPASAWCAEGCGGDGPTPREAIEQLACLAPGNVTPNPANRESERA